MCVYGYVSLCGDNMAVMLQSFVCEEIRAKVSVNVTDTVFVALQLVWHFAYPKKEILPTFPLSTLHLYFDMLHDVILTSYYMYMYMLITVVIF